MDVLYFILLLLACICFLIAALGREVNSRIAFLPLGLLLWALVPLIQLAHHVFH